MTTQIVAIAFAVGLLTCAGVMLVIFGLTPAVPKSASEKPRKFALPTPGRGLAAVIVGFLLFVVSGWVLAGAVGGLVVFSWGRVFRSTVATGDRVRLEAIAKWLEDLRDVVRGSNLSMESALEQTAGSPPTAIASELSRFVGLRRRAVPIEECLLQLADDLAHPTSDSAIAAMLLAVGTSGASLAATLSSLAIVARDEVAARTKSDRMRSTYESTMRRLVILAFGIVGFLRFFASEMLRPLSTPAGQLWLIVPIGVWVGSTVWLRSLAGYELPRRYRLRALTQ